ncbi:Aste57867_10392 [Aphanomyces stellatus]|uniref:Aste57867_10392 protein n=1 Tax=Aphanomyces stellatus TaxID=120398 RepID=A0A485KQR5_9STRA|nr:hypothetical protein As57867_010352 [Aphanomyces stellatus]VFT87266.1 Aste57867_10392 [Aphanomyces stellatus]
MHKDVMQARMEVVHNMSSDSDSNGVHPSHDEADDHLQSNDSTYGTSKNAYWLYYHQRLRNGLWSYDDANNAEREDGANNAERDNGGNDAERDDASIEAALGKMIYVEGNIYDGDERAPMRNLL